VSSSFRRNESEAAIVVFNTHRASLLRKGSSYDLIVMKICDVQAYTVKIPRNIQGALGTPGSPALLTDIESGKVPGLPSFTYKWADINQTIYSTRIETTLVRVETDSGIVGWGESQSPVAPEITRIIIESLLRPIIIGEDAQAPEILWSRMYQAMLVRGHTGSFLRDAIAGIDIALWDICGKAWGQPVCRLFGVDASFGDALLHLGFGRAGPRVACLLRAVAGGSRGAQFQSLPRYDTARMFATDRSLAR